MWVRFPDDSEGPIFVITHPEDCDGDALYVRVTAEADPDSFTLPVKAKEHSCLESDCFCDFSTLDSADMRRLGDALKNKTTKRYERLESATEGLLLRMQSAALSYPLITPLQEDLVKRAQARSTTGSRGRIRCEGGDHQ